MNCSRSSTRPRMETTEKTIPTRNARRCRRSTAVGATNSAAVKVSLVWVHSIMFGLAPLAGMCHLRGRRNFFAPHLRIAGHALRHVTALRFRHFSQSCVLAQLQRSDIGGDAPAVFHPDLGRVVRHSTEAVGHHVKVM